MERACSSSPPIVSSVLSIDLVMTGVPLLRLPFLPQMEILKHVDSEDLFYLSCISARSKALVQLANRSIEGVNVQFRMEKELYVFTEKVPLVRLKEKVDLPTFQGVDKMAICSVVKFPVVFYEAGKYQEMESRVIRHLFSVFKKVEKLAVYLTDVEKINSNPLWNYAKNIDDLIVSMQKRKLTDEEVTFLFEELTVSDKLSISAPTNGFEHTVSPVLPHCPIDAIIASKSTDIKIACPLPPAVDLNRLLKAWIAGGSMQNLYRIHIGSNQDAPPGFMNEVLDGITVVLRNGSVTLISLIHRVDGREGAVYLTATGFLFHAFVL